MPARQPFTFLCQQLARGRFTGRADLHLHTTCSDGSYSPAEIVDLARRCSLSAIAITDHDTMAGVRAARSRAEPTLEVIAGAEITCEFRDRELHLLAFFVDLDDSALNAALTSICAGRVERFRAMIERLRQIGVSVDSDRIDASRESLGRRYLAQVLVEQGQARSIREAFQRWLADGGRACVNKKRLPVDQAIALVHGAGGVAAWAHPAYDGTKTALLELAEMGLDAVEVEFPEQKRSHAQQWRAWAMQLGLAVSGGSDCHGPGPRSVGSCTISDEELDRLRSHRGGPCSAP